MTVALWCLLAVLIWPYLLVIPLSAYRKQQCGGYDNNHPRLQEPQLTGAGARMLAAHYNALEARVLFASAAIVAHILNADPFYSSIAALTFVVCRVLHTIFYVKDLAGLRTMVFAIGQLSCLALFVLAAIA